MHLVIRADNGAVLGDPTVDHHTHDGLSYTSLSYDEIQVVISGQDGCEVEVRLTNTGNAMGAEVIQLYVAPQNARVLRPVKELMGFEKVQLAPNESVVVRFELSR